MSPKTLLRVTVGISALLTIAVITAYVMNFHKSSVSTDPAIWGNLGDYFGGILNPLLSIMNLVILIYITFQIAESEEKRNENEIAIQKQIALYSLKHDALKDIHKLLEKVQLAVVDFDKDQYIPLIAIRNEFHAFIHTNSYLFPSFKSKTWKPLKESILVLAEHAKELYSLDKKNGNVSEYMHEKVIPDLDKFLELKVDFIVEVQEKVLA